MTDTKELEKRIRDAGLKQGWIAGQLGLSLYGFSRKVKGLSEFKQSEISALAQILRLSQADIRRIFFAVQVDES